jgi:methanogen homoaconitase small subunit
VQFAAKNSPLIIKNRAIHSKTVKRSKTVVRIWKFGADVDTDQIVPGRYAPYMRPDHDVGDAAFIEARPDFNRDAAPGDIIVAGNNFGCGSSREYAPLALRRRRIGAIIAVSFARIFFRNGVNLGIPLFVAPAVVAAVADGDWAELDLGSFALTVGPDTFDLPPLPPFARALVDAGGVVPYVRQHGTFPATGGGSSS